MSLDLKFILGFFNDATHPISFEEIIESLNISESEMVELNSILDKLIESGAIVKTKNDRYGTPSKLNLVVGRVQVHPDGYGFIIPDDETEEDLYVSPRQLKEVMNNDTVIARKQLSHRTKKSEGKIIRLIKRANTHVIGRFERRKRFGYVISMNPSILHDIYVPMENAMDAPDGVIVSAEITKYPTKHLNPEGRIVKVFGMTTDSEVEVESVLQKYMIADRFPEEVISQSNNIKLEINENTLKNRVDLRGNATFTVDGENAKDFDDAVGIKAVKSGFVLYVSIADVSHYVKENSPIDREAYARSTSVYFLDRVVPMLPERLSNDLCSLRPNEERLTMTVEMEFDQMGELVDYSFYKSIIKSDYRLTYSEVKLIVENKDQALIDKYSKILEELSNMKTLALILKNKRRLRGSIDFDLPEADIVIDLQGNPENIIKRERNIAHQIIEEFMLAANETVAKHLNWMNVPSIYRVHEEPAPEKLADFKTLVFNLGYQLKLTSKVHPKGFQTLLDDVKDKPEEMLINRVMLRTMQQAKYLPINQGHFALATNDYTHFTSPIRRYPDLIVHRILSMTLANKKISEEMVLKLENELTRMAEHCSKKERLAEAAEREIIKLKKVQFMVDKIGDVFEGFVSGVNSFGLFVELSDIFVEGLIHVSSLHDDYYKFYEKEHMLIGNNLKKIFRIGDMVRVKLIKADVDKKEIDFELIEKI